MVKTDLETHNPMNAVRPEDTEFALAIAAKVGEASAALAGAGECHLVDGAGSQPVFILEQDHRLTLHRCGQAKIRKFHNLARDRRRRGRNWGLWFRFHSSIEAEAMYPLK
jgi:hypothetical protein